MVGGMHGGSGGVGSGAVAGAKPEVRMITNNTNLKLPKNLPYYCLKGIMPYKANADSLTTKAEVITVYHEDLGEPVKTSIFNFTGKKNEDTGDDMEGRPCLVIITKKGYVLINAHFGHPMPFVENFTKIGLSFPEGVSVNDDEVNLVPPSESREELSKSWRKWFLEKMGSEFSKQFNQSVGGENSVGSVEVKGNNNVKSCCHGSEIFFDESTLEQGNEQYN